MRIPLFFVAALLMVGPAFAAQPSASAPVSITAPQISQTVAAGVPVSMSGNRAWYREAALVTGIGFVVATFIFAFASKRDSA